MHIRGASIHSFCFEATSALSRTPVLSPHSHRDPQSPSQNRVHSTSGLRHIANKLIARIEGRISTRATTWSIKSAIVPLRTCFQQRDLLQCSYRRRKLRHIRRIKRRHICGFSFREKVEKPLPIE